MNLLLHGLEYPHIESHNALDKPLREMGDRDRVDVIVTNPPFGGEEEHGIRSNFPEDKRTSETALLFLQLIMRKLRPARSRRKARALRHGRAQRSAFRRWRLRSNQGGTSQGFQSACHRSSAQRRVCPVHQHPTNLLFFDRSGPTRDIWYYEQPLPEGRKNYTKTQPMQFEEFSTCLSWFKKREANDRAWKVSAKDVLKYDASGALVSANLDIKNPNSKQDFEHVPPGQLADDILKKEQRIAELMTEIKQILSQGVAAE